VTDETLSTVAIAPVQTTDGLSDALSVQVIDSHREHLEYLNRRPGTVTQRVLTLHRLAQHADRPLLELDEAALRAFITQPSLGVEARAAAVSHLRGFYKWAVDEGLLATDPSFRLTRPKRERRLPRPMVDDHASIALNQAESPVREWLYLAAYAGLRACEIAQLKPRDFLVGQIPPMLVIRESKGGDPSVVPIAAELRPIIASLAASPEMWCFPKGRGGDGHVTANQLQRRANRFLHELGIPETLHQLRHWYGTQAFRATGRDLRATQELMRHRSPVSTAGYTFVDPGEIAAALDHLPKLTA
jgi:integrase/recombinase XerD